MSNLVLELEISSKSKENLELAFLMSLVSSFEPMMRSGVGCGAVYNRDYRRKIVYTTKLNDSVSCGLP